MHEILLIILISTIITLKKLKEWELNMQKELYTNGIDRISIIRKIHSGYLIKDIHNKTLIISNLKGYRLIGDTSTIKDWYKDSKTYIRKHPIAAILAGLGVVFGITSF